MSIMGDGSSGTEATTLVGWTRSSSITDFEYPTDVPEDVLREDFGGTIPPLRAGAVYKFLVQSENAAGKGGLTNIPLVIQAASKPGKPGRPKHGPFQTSESSVYFSWEPAQDNGTPILGYVIERSTDLILWTNLTAVPPDFYEPGFPYYTKTYFSDSEDTIVMKRTYSYRVYAVNAVRTPYGIVNYSPFVSWDGTCINGKTLDSWHPESRVMNSTEDIVCITGHVCV